MGRLGSKRSPINVHYAWCLSKLFLFDRRAFPTALGNPAWSKQHHRSWSLALRIWLANFDLHRLHWLAHEEYKSHSLENVRKCLRQSRDGTRRKNPSFLGAASIQISSPRSLAAHCLMAICEVPTPTSPPSGGGRALAERCMPEPPAGLVTGGFRSCACWSALIVASSPAWETNEQGPFVGIPAFGLAN